MNPKKLVTHPDWEAAVKKQAAKQEPSAKAKSKNKSAEDYRFEVKIQSSLLSLSTLKQDIPELDALKTAIRDRNWRAIADAALAMEQVFSPRGFLEDAQMMMIVLSPSSFGLKVISKADILFIMQTTTPGWKPPADMRKHWKRLHLDHLPQGRGYSPELNAWAREYEASERAALHRKLIEMGPHPLFLRC